MKRKDRRNLLYSLLGDLPPRDRPVSAETLRVEERGNYTLEVLRLDLNGEEPVPAYFTRPKTPGPWPAVIYNHSHGGNYALGKDEFLHGREYIVSPWADELALRGICALCIDHRCFGERRDLSESEAFKLALWRGQVLWGLMVYDTLKATDYLVSRPDVFPSRIATLGMSMGSVMAQWHAALDERVAACVDICCLTDYASLIARRRLDAHGLYYYVPGLLKEFTAADVNALICPRPHLALAGNMDGLTPPEGLDRIDAQLRQVYADAGVLRAWELERYPCGHVELPEMRERAIRFLANAMQ
ncbi:MAG TPA: alpha/beta hydrolase [Armatimonadota bacterium]